ncbi:MAG: SAM-dependent DNA methyltransferase, partial [Sciscionella sp.]
TYHAWRGEKDSGRYGDLPGFCKSASKEEISSHGYIINPGRYVGAEDQEDNGEPFQEKMLRLTATLRDQFHQAENLASIINRDLSRIGYGKE